MFSFMTKFNKLNLKKSKKELSDKGYTLVRNMLNGVQTTALFDEVNHIIKHTQPPYENLMQTSQYLKGSHLDGLINSTQLLDIAGELCGGPCVRFLPFTAVKGAGGGKFQFHQDDQYRRFDALGINFWFALTDADETNGCLSIVPESHELGKVPWIETGDANRSRTIEWEPQDAIPVIMKAGDCLIFNRLTLHSSGENQSAESRVGYSITYAREHTKFLDQDNCWKPLKSCSRWETPATERLQLVSSMRRGGNR